MKKCLLNNNETNISLPLHKMDKMKGIGFKRGFTDDNHINSRGAKLIIRQAEYLAQIVLRGPDEGNPDEGVFLESLKLVKIFPSNKTIKRSKEKQTPVSG